MTDDEASSTLKAAASLEKAMENLGGEIQNLRRYGHRNRVLIWLLGAALSLVLVLGVLVYFVAVETGRASAAADRAALQAAQNRQSQVTTCEAGNQARAVSTQLWTYLLDLAEKSPPVAGSDPATRQRQVAQFRAYIATAYAPRDCRAG